MTRRETGYVYLVLAPSSGLHKIGLSTAPVRRMVGINAAAGEKCVLIHTIKTNDAPRLEREFHDAHAAKRVSGEWFRLTAEDVAAFAARQEQSYEAGKAIRQSEGRRIMGLPQALADALQEIADEQFTTLAQVVKAAVIEHLKSRGRFPESLGK